jgi:regulator of sigma E protease
MNSSVPPNSKNDVSLYDEAKDAKDNKTPSGFRNFRFLGFLVFFLIFIIPYGYYHGFTAFFFSLITFLEVVLLFNVLIIVHELGHFLAAKWCGLQIDKFAIWFGKPLWSKKIDGVEYILGSIPAGGYVALPQMAPMEAIEGKTETPREELPPASPWQKIIVAFAGPLFSFGLALFFATIVWAVGKPTTATEKTTTIGFVIPGGPADKAGLHTGDVIKSINGHRVTRWAGVDNGVTWTIMTSTVTPLTMVVQRAGQPMTFEVTPEVDPTVKHHWWDRSAPFKIEIAPEVKDLVVGKVLPDSPAAVAGIQKGDKLTALDGQQLLGYYAIYQHLKDTPFAPLNLTVTRGEQSLSLVVQPEKPIQPTAIPKDEPQTAIGLDLDDSVDVVMDHPTPWHQVHESVDMVRGTLAALFTHNSRVSATQLSGPVGIMNILFEVLSSENGWRVALWFAVVINVNLAMLNLFPLPVLDGGHIALSLIEWVRRRPLSMNILEPVQTACALALIGYMAFITFFDVQDSGKMAFGSDSGEMKFAPKQSGQ